MNLLAKEKFGWLIQFLQEKLKTKTGITKDEFRQMVERIIETFREHGCTIDDELFVMSTITWILIKMGRDEQG